MQFILEELVLRGLADANPDDYVFNSTRVEEVERPENKQQIYTITRGEMTLRFRMMITGDRCEFIVDNGDANGTEPDATEPQLLDE